MNYEIFSVEVRDSELLSMIVGSVTGDEWKVEETVMKQIVPVRAFSLGALRPIGSHHPVTLQEKVIGIEMVRK